MNNSLKKKTLQIFSQMFKGNTGADSIKYNVFEVPIIAQWVRINPTRWRDRISLRAELYGCEYSKFYFQPHECNCFRFQ